MKFLCFTVLLMVSVGAYGQIQYTKGYFIDNEDRRVEVLIYDTDWKNSPESFTYKESADGVEKKAELSNVKEFGVGKATFIRAAVKIDGSSSEKSKTDYNRYPKWEEKTLFLRVLEAGPATLYVYNAPQMERFFFSVNESPIEQLVYKYYLVTGSTAGENKTFLNQLQLKVNCGGKGNTPAFMKMDYSTDPLKKYFADFNKCSGFEKTETKVDSNAPSKFRLKVAPGLDMSSLVLTNYASGVSRESGMTQSIRIGVEAEFVLPFNKNKWAFIVEPTYQQFSHDDPYIKIDYTSIEIPVGVRHYFFLNESSQIFLNGAFVLDFPMGEKKINTLELKSTSNLAFGLGYQWNNFSLEGRYYSNRELLNRNDVSTVESDYKKTSIILGYKFSFQKKKGKS